MNLDSDLCIYLNVFKVFMRDQMNKRPNTYRPNWERSEKQRTVSQMVEIDFFEFGQAGSGYFQIFN